MGLFGQMFKGGFAFNKLAKAVGTIIELLDAYEIDKDFTLLCEAAWLCRLGVLDKIETYHYGMTASIYVSIRGSLQKMALSEALMRSYGRILAKSEELQSSQKEIIEDIMAKEQAFYDFDKRVSFEDKQKYV